MNTRRVSALCMRIVLITMIIWTPLRAADDAGSVRLASAEQPVYAAPPAWSNQPAYGGQVGTTSVGGEQPGPMELFFRFRSDGGNGLYKDGYQTLAAVVPYFLDGGDSLFFVEGRGYVTNQSDFGGNVGGGYRYFSLAGDRVYGLTGWYDYDDTNFHDFGRWGISYESLSNQGLTYRVNGYIANDRTRKFVSRTTGIPAFVGFNIAQATDTIYEAPYSGVDGEVGMPLPLLGDLGFKAFVGAYFMEAPGGDDAIGPKVRVQGQLARNIWGQMEYTDDDVFGSNITLAISIDLRGGVLPVFAPKPTDEMLTQQVLRQYRVPVGEQLTRDYAYAINPVDMEPFMVYHVDNTAGAGGDGSFESPYDTLPSSVTPDADIIFVNRGDGTSSGLTGDFLLQDNQRLLGEGTMHTYTSTEGTFALPGYTPGVNPLLGGTVDMFGDNVEVAGFRFSTPSTQSAIIGSGEDFLIRSVDIMGGDRGIDLDNATGFGLITDTTITGTARDAIHVENYDSTTLDLAIVDTTITDGGEDGVYVTVDTEATLNLSMDNVDVSGVAANGFGTDVSFFNTMLSVDVVDSSFSFNGGDGFYVERVDDSGFMVDISDSIFDGNLGDGVNIVSYNGRVPNGMVDIERSSLSGNGGLGLRLRGEADVTLDVDLTDNVIFGNGLGGVEMTSAERILLTGVWTRNIIAANGADAVAGFGDGIYLQSNLDLVLTDNDVLGNNGDGLQVEIFGNANVALDLNGNWINDNNGRGFKFDSTGSSLLLMDVDASASRISQFNNNSGDGMEFRANGDGAADLIFVAIDDTEVNFNDGRGIDLLTQEDGSAEYFLNNTQVSANGEEGIYLVNTSSGTQTQDVPSFDPLADDGALDQIPTTALYIENSEIDANGSLLTMGGVVVRVGSSDGDLGYDEPGGFASDGYGGVRFGMVNNSLSGNYDEDVVIETYRSTTNDPASGTTWSDTEFDPTGYQSDPLSRIDVVFRGNVADSISVNGIGAYYDNDDAVFHSRDDMQTDPGPFTSGTRRRNATRLAFRGGVYSVPGTPGGASDDFLYSGVGGSVMRIESDYDQAGIDILAPGFNSSIGFAGAIFGELSFTWDTIPPGTVFP